MVVVVLTAGAAVCRTAASATLTWNTTNGIWNLTDVNWTASGSGTTWSQTSTTSPLDDAVFGGADGTYAITVSGQVAARSLRFDNSGYALSSGTVFVTATSTAVTVAAGKTATINSYLTTTSNGSWALTTSGTLNLGGGIGFSQLNTDGNGTVNITSGSSSLSVTNFKSATVNQTGGIVSLGGSQSAGNFINYTAGRNVTYTISGGTLRLNGGTTGTGAYLSLGRSNSATGATLTVKDGATVVIGTDAGGHGNINIGQDANSTGTLDIQGGLLTVAGTTNVIRLFGAGADANRQARMLVSGGTSTVRGINFGGGSGTYNATSSATLSLSGGSLFIGAGGIVRGSGAANLPVTITLSGGTLGAAAGWTSSLPMTLTATAGGATIHAADASGTARNITLNGTLSGTGGFLKTGSGILTLGGSNSYSGTTAVQAGTLAVGHVDALSGDGSIRFVGGTLRYSGSNTVDYSNRITSSGSAVTIDTNGQDVSFASGLAATNTGGLTKTGVGTLTLSASNAYVGTTTVTGGTLALTSGGVIGGSTSSLVVSNGAALRIGSGASVSASGTMRVTGTSAIYLESGGALVLTQSGGNVQFVADATGSGATAGVLASSGAAGTGGTMSVAASTLRPAGMNNSNYTFTFDNVIVSATGAAFEVGRGGSGNTVILTNGGQVTALAPVVSIDANNYTLNINAGSTLSIRNNGNLSLRGGGGGTNTRLNIDGGTISGVGALTFNNAPNSTVTITNGGLFSSNSNSTISATNAVVSITGTGSHWNMNDRTLGLGGAGVESNTLRLFSGGRLTAASVSVATGGNVLEFDGGVLASATTGTLLSGSTRIKSGGAVFDTGAFSSTVSSSLAEDTGSTGGGLQKLGFGTLALSGVNTYSGTTTISAGILSFGSSTALQATSGVDIVGGAGLAYTGGAATFDRTITVTSGTGTVRNTGNGILSLSNTLTKNGTVLRFNTGTFTISGLITGASPNSDLVVDAATVTLTNSNNDYNGPTIVQNGGTLILGANNVISSTSAVTVDASTLTVGGFTDTIQSLTTAGNSTINVAASGSTSGGLTMGNLAFGAGIDTLGLTMTSPTAGRYTLFAYTGTRTGTFDSVSGLDSNYTLVYGAASNGSIDLQMKASVGTVATTVVNPVIIVGGTAGLTYTVANTTPTGGATLSFTSTNGPGVVGSSNGSALAGQTSGTVSGLGFVGSTVGLAQPGAFTVADSAAIVTTGTGSFTVDVLNHSLASFAAGDTATTILDFGTYDPATGLWSGGDGGNGTLGFSLFNIASGGFTNTQTAGLDLYDWTVTGDAVFSPGLSLFANLAAGSSNAFSASVASPGSLTEGIYSATYTLKFRDQDLPGAANTRDLTLTANVIVVPEPAAWLCGLIGVIVAVATSRRLG